MKTIPNVQRFAPRDALKISQSAREKADGEGDSYKFMRISSDHYACVTKTPIKGGTDDNTYIIIEKDGKIGCSCPDMTYRGVCKHIAKFANLPTPPQTQASEEIVRKLILMGWIGGRDDLHPAELSPVAHVTDDAHEDPDYPDRIVPAMPDRPTEDCSNSESERVTYTCPKCGEVVNTESTKLMEWKLSHMDVCQGSKKTKTHPDQRPASVQEVSENVGAVAPGAEPPLVPGIHDSPQTPEQVIPSNPIDPQVPANLATALCNMQKIDLLAVTDSSNPFHNSKYADLASVWAAIRKPLTDNGLAVIQTTEQYQDGITVVTTLMHTSGESFTARLSCEVPKSKPDKNGQTKPNIQGLGSTITYLRRYSLTAMVGVAPIDDDGEAAMNR